MASTINATTSSGIVATADNTGQLALQAAGTTIATISSTGLTMNSGNIIQASGAAPAFNVYASVAQSIANTTHTKIQLNTEVFDTNNNFDNTTNYRFTPTVAGYYQITGSVQLASTSAISAVEIYKNGGIAAQGRGVGTGGLNQAGNVSTILYANGSTDYFELYVYQPSGGAINTTAASDLTYMCGALIRSA